MNYQPGFWAPEPVAPIAVLAELRAFVLERSHRRLPRWHFRLADDLVLRIQPRPAERRDAFYAFVGAAFQGEEITRARLDARDTRGLWRLEFGIKTAESPWSIRVYSIGGPPGWRDAATAVAGTAFRARVLATLCPERFATLDAGLLLSQHCLICGKGLTDPVSVARWIGPECAGSARLSLRIMQVPGESTLPLEAMGQ
jgi:hypothetical protein